MAKAVGAGQNWQFDTVDFSDPNRPPTCIEVDFPIVPINAIAKIESSSGAGRKAIYTMNKWWARRPSSVFRGCSSLPPSRPRMIRPKPPSSSGTPTTAITNAKAPSST
ncbi:DUF1156 domain-containing protein [Fodinicurvata halophila]|uniref:DUF1156 domain-containing protein n=1 Tax=Fodinicurvata halophila TaxID=1419723 RepID=UPI00363F8060